LWLHQGGIPTDIYRYHSSNLTSWSSDGVKISRTGTDEGAGVGTGQVADPFGVIYNGVFYLFYEASYDGTAYDAGHPTNIKLITGKESLLWE
jgi:hypothetical protein